MTTDNIIVNTQSSIRIEYDKVIYFDPYKIKEDKHDADIIFITHDHYDHLDTESINKIKKDNTVIIAPQSIENSIKNIEVKDYIYLKPDDEINIDDINIKAVRAYNIEKPFHPKESNWLGYIVSIKGITYYIAGDTDKTKEAENVVCDIALIPIGGHFTMDVEDATELVKIINPKIVIPTHYGSIIGDINEGKRLKNNLSNTNIEVIEKLNQD